jgi:tetratricopeptide (TPR) repeat protein
MKLLPAALAVVLVACVGVAQAQSLPKPKEFYFDEDRAAAPIVVVEGEGEALAEKLLRERERGRNKIEATAQLAHVAMSSDRIELGQTLYEQAVAATSDNSRTGRAVRWNYGWDLYRSGKPAAALAQWSEAINGLGGPSWIPPTLAVALWKLDRRGEAVEWYAASVRTYPRRWHSATSSNEVLPHWRQEDRDLLADIHDAWQANPPAWP